MAWGWLPCSAIAISARGASACAPEAAIQPDDFMAAAMQAYEGPLRPHLYSNCGCNVKGSALKSSAVVFIIDLQFATDCKTMWAEKGLALHEFEQLDVAEGWMNSFR
jgi:hypothetical protein